MVLVEELIWKLHLAITGTLCPFLQTVPGQKTSLSLTVVEKDTRVPLLLLLSPHILTFAKFPIPTAHKGQ